MKVASVMNNVEDDKDDEGETNSDELNLVGATENYEDKEAEGSMSLDVTTKENGLMIKFETVDEYTEDTKIIEDDTKSEEGEGNHNDVAAVTESTDSLNLEDRTTENGLTVRFLTVDKNMKYEKSIEDEEKAKEIGSRDNELNHMGETEDNGVESSTGLGTTSKENNLMKVATVA